MNTTIALSWAFALMGVAALIGLVVGYFARGFTDACKEMERREEAWGDYPAPQRKEAEDEQG